MVQSVLKPLIFLSAGHNRLEKKHVVVPQDTLSILRRPLI